MPRETGWFGGTLGREGGNSPRFGAIPYAPAPLPAAHAVARTSSLFLKRLLLGLLLGLLVLTLLRSFVGDVYRVDSTSMEPTLHATPERVFVRFERGFRPGRFDLVVFPSPDAGAVVKRAAGLPSESILLSGGDLLIEGKRLAADVPRPEPVLLFDSDQEPLSSGFTASPEPLAPPGHGVDASGRRIDLVYGRPARDDWIGADGIRREGTHPVNDLRLEGELSFEGSGKLTVRLTEEADAFELELEVTESAARRWRLLRRAGTAQPEVLDKGDLPPAAGALGFALENVDNHVSALVGAVETLVNYDANTPREGVVDDLDRHLEPRVHLAAAGLKVHFSRLAVLRDLYYTADGPLGTGSPVALGPDEIFVLGDNSANSHDSRWIGPVRMGELIGRATRVLWPRSAARKLGGLRQPRTAQPVD